MFRDSPVGRPHFHRWWMTRIAQPLSCLSFITGASLSWQTFPGHFDWRYDVVSDLLFPGKNPRGYRWISLGILLSGFLLLPLGHYFRRCLQPFAPLGARLVHCLMTCGLTGLIIIAIFPHSPGSLPLLHDTLAMSSYCILSLGLLTTAMLLGRHPQATNLGTRYRRWIPLLLFAAIFGPVLGTLLTQFTVYLSLGYAPALHDKALPSYLSIAFWEWILSGMLYASSGLLAWIAAPPDPVAFPQRNRTGF